MNLLDEIIDVAVGSSRVMSTVIKDMLILSNEIKDIKESLATITKAIQIHQIAISELVNNLSQDSFEDSIVDSGHTKNTKKDKPN